jgi:glyoxylase-like metal-dependent hydrolase (beta-lactamase superfamily II)
MRAGKRMPITLGNVTIHRVVEQQSPLFDVLEFFPSLTKEVLDQHRSWLEPEFLDPATNKIVLCVQSYVVRTPHHIILVDTCVGNHKSRPARPFWHMMTSDRYEQNLAAAGLAVGDVDYVMCTHLHPDHVGWNTRLDNGRWVPTFPKAKYLFADRELAYWTEKQKEQPAAHPHITDSVLPIVEAQRAQVVRSDHALDDLVRLVPSPGHTIDHYSVHVGTSAQDAFLTGDMIHSPLQARYPELGMRADYDSKQAGATRRALFERFCDTSTLMCTAHFPAPSTGRVARWDDGFKIVPA